MTRAHGTSSTHHAGSRQAVALQAASPRPVPQQSLRFVRRGRGRARGGSGAGASGESVHDEDPLAGIANLFDVSVAFIVALLIALFGLFSAGSMLDPASNVTLVKQSSNGQMEIITKKGAEISVQKVTDKSMSGEGVRLGTAYRLANGQVVYVPEGEAPPEGAAPPTGGGASGVNGAAAPPRERPR